MRVQRNCDEEAHCTMRRWEPRNVRRRTVPKSRLPSFQTAIQRCHRAKHYPWTLRSRSHPLHTPCIQRILPLKARDPTARWCDVRGELARGDAGVVQWVRFLRSDWLLSPGGILTCGAANGFAASDWLPAPVGEVMQSLPGRSVEVLGALQKAARRRILAGSGRSHPFPQQPLGGQRQKPLRGVASALRR
jgi:hypothetical protein